MESPWLNDLAGIALILGVILAASAPIGLVIFTKTDNSISRQANFRYHG